MKITIDEVYEEKQNSIEVSIDQDGDLVLSINYNDPITIDVATLREVIKFLQKQ